MGHRKEKNPHFLHGIGKNGTFFGTITLISKIICTCNYFQVNYIDPNSIQKHFGLVIRTKDNLVSEKYVFFGKFTYVLFIAATITVIYSEISFILGKYFFPNFVSENVSKEIIYMFSFIVFINVGYFTFMLILDILKAESVY